MSLTAAEVWHKTHGEALSNTMTREHYRRCPVMLDVPAGIRQRQKIACPACGESLDVIVYSEWMTALCFVFGVGVVLAIVVGVGLLLGLNKDSAKSLQQFGFFLLAIPAPLLALFMLTIWIREKEAGVSVGLPGSARHEVKVVARVKSVAAPK